MPHVYTIIISGFGLAELVCILAWLLLAAYKFGSYASDTALRVSKIVRTLLIFATALLAGWAIFTIPFPTHQSTVTIDYAAR